MSGLGDALKQEASNMQKGLQDAHDIWMGQRPIPTYETHDITNWEPLGPSENTEETKPGSTGVPLAAKFEAMNDPSDWAAEAPADTPSYDPPIGPDPVQNQDQEM